MSKSNWEKFTKNPQAGEPPLQSRKIGGVYQCQFCPAFVTEAIYFPNDLVLKYTCPEEHVSYLENFKVMF